MLQPPLQPAARAANDRLRAAAPILLPAPPVLDFDFVGRPSLQYPGLPAITFARASEATMRRADGTRIIVGSDVPRFEPGRGLLIEGQRTNFLLHATAPATQTTGNLGAGTYTLWVEGAGSAAVTANTAAVTGAGTATAGAPVTFTVTDAGTVDITVTGALTAFQLEDGAFASSLIVTAGATATRVTELANITTSVFDFNPDAGTLLWCGRLIGFAGGLTLSDGTTNNQINLRLRSGRTLGQVVTTLGTTVVNTTSTNTATANIQFKAVMAWAVNDYVASLNSGPMITDTSGAVPAELAMFKLTGDDSTLPYNGWLERVTYWPQRLSSCALQLLTRDSQ